MFHQVQVLCSRSFQTSAVWKDNKDKAVKETLKAGPLESLQGKFPDNPPHKVKFIDRFFLVASRRYKTWGDVPTHVEYVEMHMVRGWARVRINIFSILVGLCLAGSMVYIGKREHMGGRSVASENLEWHREENRKYLEKLAEMQATGKFTRDEK